jgi:hypothetical protein
VGTILGLPLVFQTYRKTRAEIAKINLEAAKLAREAEGLESGASPESVMVRIDRGHGNVVTVAVDPRLRGPLLVLIDAVIAAIFSTLASYAIGLLSSIGLFPLDFIIQPLRIAAYLIFFLPVLRAARQVKAEIGKSDPRQQRNLAMMHEILSLLRAVRCHSRCFW